MDPGGKHDIDRLLGEIVPEPDTPTRAARAVAILVRAGAQAFPLSAAAVYAWDQHRTAIEWRRTADLIEAIVEKLHTLGVREDLYHVGPDAPRLVAELLDKSREQAFWEKREYYAAAAVRAIAGQAPELAMEQRMVDILDRLRISHLELLALIEQTASLESAPGIPGWVGPALRILRPEADPELESMDWADLYGFGLIGSQKPESGWAPDQAVGELSKMLTPFGQRFLAFIRPEVTPAEDPR